MLNMFSLNINLNKYIRKNVKTLYPSLTRNIPILIYRLIYVMKKDRMFSRGHKTHKRVYNLITYLNFNSVTVLLFKIFFVMVDKLS